MIGWWFALMILAPLATIGYLLNESKLGAFLFLLVSLFVWSPVWTAFVRI